MNKHICIGVLFVIIFSVMAATAYAAKNIKIYVDGDAVVSDVPAQIINGRTMVPLRAVAENLGADVEWDSFRNAVWIRTKSQNTGNIEATTWLCDTQAALVKTNSIIQMMNSSDTRESLTDLREISRRLDTVIWAYVSINPSDDQVMTCNKVILAVCAFKNSIDLGIRGLEELERGNYQASEIFLDESINQVSRIPLWR